MNRILIAEDEAVIRAQLAKRLCREGYQVAEADSAEAARALDPSAFDLVIADLRLPGAPGTELIEAAGETPVLIMTSYASIPSAVECIKRGAADYIAKPFEFDELLLTVRRLLEQSLLRRQNAALRQDLDRDYPIDGIIGRCPAMRQVADHVRRVATTDVTVLICGESGTGKELVARAIHGLGGRGRGPFVAVNCAAIPDTLIEAELFGHERGAFTGALQRKAGLFDAAHGGTLFLDEVGELSLAAQARLLRALQEGEIRAVGATAAKHVDVRVIAATHRDLGAMVIEKSFREDLFYRLRVMEIDLPPLRSRGDDIDLLADHLLGQIGARLGRSHLQLSPAARRRLREYRWPGNVRELANCLERAAILCDQQTLEPTDLGLKAPPVASGDDLSLDDYFRDFVLRNQQHLTESELARRLGISRKSLWERRHRMGIPRTAARHQHG